MTQCKVCSNVSFLNEDYQCSLCSIYLDGCLYCEVGSECQECQSGYYLYLGKCLQCDHTQFGTVEPMNKSICLACSYSGTTAICSSCLETYYLSAGNCSLCTSSISNCYACTSGVLCTKCMDGYYLSPYSTSCIQCDPSLVYCIECNA